MAKSRTLRLRVWGRNACFTRPEMKVERVSYDLMTPSAARGILEAILWKPAIVWRVTRIDVLAPIKWESVRRNEIGAVASTRSQGLFIEDNRQQRAGLFLRDVDYIIHAHFEMTKRAGDTDNIIKFEEIFKRRTTRGQCFHRPYLGCREFAANFAPVGSEERAAISKTRDLGFMLYDISHDNSADKNGVHFCGSNCHPLFFRAELKDGSLLVPTVESGEVRG